MFDFEGGPCLTVGGKVRYGNLNWKILDIKQEKSNQANLSSVLLKVKPLY
jgi:hypothetical protein